MYQPLPSFRRPRGLRLTARGWVAAGSGAVCIVLAYSLTRRELLVVGCLALLLAVGGVLVTSLRRPRLEVIRLFSPPVVSAGSVARVTLRLRNRAALSTPVLTVHDDLPWTERQEHRSVEPLGVGSAGRRVAVLEYEAHPARRGVFPLGPLVVEYGDPFGMARTEIASGHADRLTVVPAIVDLPDGGPVLVEGEGAAQLVQRHATGNDDDLSTREYRVGDALRRVHWRASARHGELMVRQEEHRSNPDARIVIDTRLASYPDASGGTESWPPAPHSERFEWAVRMLASLAVHLDRNGFRVEVVESTKAQIEPIGERWQGGPRVEPFLMSLAALRLVDARYDARPRLATDASGPTFAILADAGDETVDWALGQKRPGQTAVAFLLGMRPEARERFEGAGWLCLDIEPEDGLEHAWLLSGETGVVR